MKNACSLSLSLIALLVTSGCHWSVANQPTDLLCPEISIISGEWILDKAEMKMAPDDLSRDEISTLIIDAHGKRSFYFSKGNFLSKNGTLIESGVTRENDFAIIKDNEKWDVWFYWSESNNTYAKKATLYKQDNGFFLRFPVQEASNGSSSRLNAIILKRVKSR